MNFEYWVFAVLTFLTSHVLLDENSELLRTLSSFLLENLLVGLEVENSNVYERCKRALLGLAVQFGFYNTLRGVLQIICFFPSLRLVSLRFLFHLFALYQSTFPFFNASSLITFEPSVLTKI